MSTKLNNIREKYENNLYFDQQSLKSFQIKNLLLGRLNFRGRKFSSFNNFLLLNELLKKKTKQEPFYVLLIVILKLMPKVFLKPFYVGRVKQNIPVPISEKKQLTLIMK